MDSDEQTAVVVPVAAAEGVVGEHRARLDPAAAWGVPAHVTILYPFVAPAAVDRDLVDRLAAVCSRVPRFDCSFDRCAWFGDDVLWLAPEPDAPFRELVREVVAAFPGHPPYGGDHPEVVPHLTVGHTGGATLEALRAAESAVGRALPVVAHLDRALLLAGSDRPGSWHPVATLPLGERTRA